MPSAAIIPPSLALVFVRDATTPLVLLALAYALLLGFAIAF